MKKKLLILAVIASGFLTSCKDFLEPDSLSTFDVNYIYSNPDDARKGVNAIYESFGQDAFRSRLSNNMAGNTDIEHQSGWSSTADRYQIWDLNALATNGDLRIVWNAAYTSIRNCNIAIEGIEASDALKSTDAATSRKMYQMLGEAYTMRAYWYSMLTLYFGDVPNVRQAPKAGNNFFLPKEDRNVILSQVIDDLIKIEDKMLWADQNSYSIEQINREYTMGMIARLALQRGGYYLTPAMQMERKSDYLDYYKIAKTYTEKLISLKDRALPTDFKQVFLNESKFVTPSNSDVLFEVPFAIGNGDVGWNIGITVEGGTTAAHSYGSGNNYMAIPPTYYFSFDTLDVRRDVTCALYKINTSAQAVFVTNSMNIAQGKWSRWFLDKAPGASTAKGTGINWPMMRYSDVLLMLAEAENELNGPTEIAQSALKRVRQRAFTSTYWPTKVDDYIKSISTSKQSFFNAIVDERGWEFGGEMIRKYELIRWNLYAPKMKQMVEDLKLMADAAQTGTGKFSELPDYMYWKRDASGTFKLLNPSRKYVGTPDATWTRVSFLASLKPTPTTYADWIIKDWEKYYNGPVAGVSRYIFPIPAEAITNSQGKLANDGYGF
ncbi:RagB/SusD family nutrient uptake outer membrane protein [Flectobacillus longus]|uniref:RagB/SusD family nutrient uptake outer membrane protein n=1 Tax=Flectobacillus longus TaxID=2984207 RepID=UPI0024B81584|nr:RagB/SusD family nutrient uptake outer membrane protein [Flectobacillus longus]MDI9878806.1 RagB/SusD family nutrient uptake outer membrane protein [Flectobacillus longus]